MTVSQLERWPSLATRVAGARPAPLAPAAAATPRVYWWLLQGLALGAVGGTAVSGVVIGGVLGLRALLTGG